MVPMSDSQEGRLLRIFGQFISNLSTVYCTSKPVLTPGEYHDNNLYTGVTENSEQEEL